LRNVATLKAIILSFFRNFSQNLYTENFNEKYFLHIQIASAEPANGSFFRMHDKKKRQPKLIASFLSFFKN